MSADQKLNKEEQQEEKSSENTSVNEEFELLEASIIGHKNSTTGFMEMTWPDQVAVAKMGLGKAIVDHFCDKVVNQDTDTIKQETYTLNVDKMEKYIEWYRKNFPEVKENVEG
jgi:hypothetical protein